MIYKKKSKRLLALFISAAMAGSLCIPASAATVESNTPKEEAVYINLNADGSVREVNVVNIFELDGKEHVTDYGKYKSVRNMTTTDPLEYSDNTVTTDTGADKLYYEGKMDSDVIPWKIDIHYYMDGKEYTGNEIAGMSGALKITMNVTENKSCKGNFFDDYALQASLSLDGDTCRNIKAPDATIANVGSNKQMTYTILPGEGAQIKITADVKDFEMDGVAVNGIPLNLDVEVDDEEMMDQITELLDAIEELDDGAGELKDGVGELQDGAQSGLEEGVSGLQDGAEKLYKGTESLKDGGSGLKSGAEELKNGTMSLDKGIQSLNTGIGQIQKAVNALKAQSGTLTGGSAEFKKALTGLKKAMDAGTVTSKDLSELTKASSEIKKGIDDLASGAEKLQESISVDSYKQAMSSQGIDIGQLKTDNEKTGNSLKSLKSKLEDEIKTLKDSNIDTSMLDELKGELDTAINLLEKNSKSISKTQEYMQAANEKLSDLTRGVKELQTKYTDFDAKISELAKSLGNMPQQMSQLSSAVNTLTSEYEKIDGGITEYTGAVAQIAAEYSKVSDGAAKLANGSGVLTSGSASLYSGAGKLLSGIVEIYKGSGSLCDGTGKLDDGVAELIAGIAQLYDGSEKLKDGTGTMRSETEGMDTEITDKIDEMLESFTGDDKEITSFASEKNTDVKSVQFVIKTDEIAAEEAEETVEEQTENTSLWQKLLKLFGLN